MIVAHKTAHDRQETYFRKTMGMGRFAYNGALHHCRQPYAAGKANPSWSKPSDARHQVNAPRWRLSTRGQAFKESSAGISRKTLGWRHA